MKCSWPLLLRVVLSASLMLNGSAYAAAHASSGPATAGRHVAVGPPATTADADAPCQGNHAEPADAPSDPIESPPAGTPVSGHHGSDCCDSAQCAGACLQHVPAVTATWVPIVRGTE